MTADSTHDTPVTLELSFEDAHALWDTAVPAPRALELLPQTGRFEFSDHSADAPEE